MKTIITAVMAAMLAYSGAVEAQSFNTISNRQCHYRVVPTAVVSRQEEASLPNDTLQTDSLSDNIQEAGYGKQEKERTRYPLSVSYPLRQSKLIVTSPYGWRTHPFTGKRNFHAGVDLRANYEPVYSMLPGEVINTGYESKGGNFISLKHGNIKVTYCHLSYIGVKKGATVYAGQPIGVSGNSGQYTTGPHLHLGVRDMKTNKLVPTSVLLEFIEGFRE